MVMPVQAASAERGKAASWKSCKNTARRVTQMMKQLMYVPSSQANALTFQVGCCDSACSCWKMLEVWVRLWLGSEDVTMAGRGPVRLAALRKMTPGLLAFLTAEMLGLYLVGLRALMAERSKKDSSGLLAASVAAGSSPTLCSHWFAKSKGVESKGRLLSVDAVLVGSSVDRLVAAIASAAFTRLVLLAAACAEASASLGRGVKPTGSSSRMDRRFLPPIVQTRKLD